MNRQAVSCIVVDDEPEIRAHVARLAEENGLLVLAKAPDAQNARITIAKMRPDIVFVDVQMPGESGLELLASLRHEANPPATVLVTAFSEHALTAFELAAVDYVLKPIDRTRFAMAADRAAKVAHARQTAAALERLNVALSQTRPETIAFRDGGKIVNIRPAEITRFQAMDDYVEAITPYRSFLLSTRIGALSTFLASPPFLQVHRSHIVNLDEVSTVHVTRGRYSLEMRDGIIIPVARSRAASVREHCWIGRSA